MTSTLHYFAANEAEALRLGAALGIACAGVAVHRFPDGESLVRVAHSGAAALLYCSLNAPNAKLVEVLLAASALRDSGARRVVLVAPYLGYMRQDHAFAQGEAVSQRVIGGLIAAAFDGLVTVDPHLHRTPRLEDVVPGIVAVNVSAAATIARALADYVSPDTLLIGPDDESRQWVEAVSAPLHLETLIGSKVRLGDRAVQIELPRIERVAGRPVVLIDDLISSGGTLIDCAAQLGKAGAASIAAAATHCLASEADFAAMTANGIRPIMATATVPGTASTIPIADALAHAILHHGLG
jgi:ribose-phosphate pyrophosphokinase